ncbi:MAG: beta-galactosidase [Spirochaetales bacterium]|nr:beta-galactosidase [Spirochaetales bacterium]
MQQIIGTQYYRPPFPEARDWARDMRAIKAAGLTAVQLWVVWAWVEAEPDHFEFDDYERLIGLARQSGLGVVLSTVAAIHPYWIHRRVPGSEMVTNQGHTVISTNRRECHFGLTPGGCIDHPGVWDRMERFLSVVVTRFRERDNLLAWDIWNELRWNVHADGLVCYCDYTIAAFRAWLRERYGDLDELNRRWKRRYRRWEDVQPGKRAGRTYTEMTAFQHFVTDRSVEHGRRRYGVVKGLDPSRPVTLHGGKPTVLYGTDAYDSADQPSTALHRGNDWDFAAFSDAVGCSSFPVWEKIDLFDFTVRLDCVRSASAPGRGIWLSELQGGMSAEGFTAQTAVSAAEQQRWVWTGFAAHADTILFWSWRDESFGKESGGFGLIGRDGKAEERIAALHRTRELLDMHGDAITGFRPAETRVGIWFSPQSYYLYWCQTADAVIPMQGIQGVARALLAGSVPYRIVEETHPEALDGLKLLFMPRAVVLDREEEEPLERFLQRGGTIVVESEMGAYDSAGLYREPEDRFIYRAAGVRDAGRRPLAADHLLVDGDVTSGTATPNETGAHSAHGVDPGAGVIGPLYLPAAQWTTPQGDGEVFGSTRVGKGRLVVLGSYCFDPFYRLDTALSGSGIDGDGRDGVGSMGVPRDRLVGDMRRFVALLVAGAGVEVPVTATVPGAPGASPILYARLGRVGDGRAVVCLCDDPAAAPLVDFAFPCRGMSLRELISGERYAPRLHDDGTGDIQLQPSSWGVYWLVEE